MKQLLYFAYGSNMDLFQMKSRCPDSQPLGVAVLDDYCIKQRQYADIEPLKGSQVFGVLFKISEADLEELDLYEGYPTFYTRKEVVVQHLLGECTAIVYEMTDANKLDKQDKPYTFRYRNLCFNAAEFWNLLENVYKPDENATVANLMQALYNDDYELVEQYLLGGVNINADYNRNGWSPFMWVCKNHCNPKLVQVFLDAGGNVNARNNAGETAFLITARKRSSPQILDLLVRYGANPLVRDSSGKSALDLVREHPQASMRQSLISYLESFENQIYDYYY